MEHPASAAFPFSKRLSEGGRRALFSHPLTRVERRKLLLSPGDRADGAFLVVQGALRVFYTTPEGREATLYRVEPGGTCLLALTSTFNEEPYPAWVESGARGVAFVKVPTKSFRQLFDGEPGFRDFLFGVLSSRIFELMQVLEDAGSARIELRVSKHLLRAAGPDGVVRASQSAIAAELGTAREVVFRALRSLASRGLLETGRERVAIKDRPKLEKLVEKKR